MRARVFQIGRLKHKLGGQINKASEDKMNSQYNMTSRLAQAVIASLATGFLTLGLVACDTSKSTQASKTGSASKSEAEIAQAALDAEAAEEELTRTRKPASKSGSKADKRESVYVVQVGTFRVEANAKKVLEQLKAAGLPAFQKRIERGQENILYTVRFEPTPSKTEAEKFVESAKSLTGQNAMILSLGN